MGTYTWLKWISIIFNKEIIVVYVELKVWNHLFFIYCILFSIFLNNIFPIYEFYKNLIDALFYHYNSILCTIFSVLYRIISIEIRLKRLTYRRAEWTIWTSFITEKRAYIYIYIYYCKTFSQLFSFIKIQNYKLNCIIQSTIYLYE